MADNQTSSSQDDSATDGAKPVPPKSSSGSNKTLVIVLIVIGIIIVLPGILFAIFVFWLSSGDNARNIGESVIESSTGAEINTDSGEFSIETDEGSLNVGSENLPDNFPTGEVSLYEPQTITTSYSQSSENGSSWYVAASTDDSADEVVGFIEGAYSDWETTSTSSFNETRSFRFERDSYTVSITVAASGSDDVTAITYSIVESEDSE